MDSNGETVEGKDIYTATQDLPKFTLESVGDGAPDGSNEIHTRFDKNSPEVAQKLTQGQYNGQYFAGWNTEPNRPFTSYDAIDYPITRIGDDKTAYRGYQEGTEINVTKDKTDLYAVWVPVTNAGLFGYTLTDPDATFAGEGTALLKRWVTSDGQQLGDNGLTGETKAQKLMVLNGGYGKGSTAEFTVTKDVPSVEGKTFVGWRYKSKPNKVAMPLDTVSYPENSTSVFSLDAIWGAFSGGKSMSYEYDEQLHAIDINDLKTTFTGGGSMDVFQEASNTAVAYTYTVTKKSAGAAEEEVVTMDDAGQGLAGDVFTSLPQFRQPGVYTYTITSTVNIPADQMNSGIQRAVTIGTTTATLIITSEATLVYHMNDGSDITFADKKEASAMVGGKYVFGLKEVETAFTKDIAPRTGNYTNLDAGHIKKDSKTLYFLGWSTSPTATAINDVQYKALDVSKEQRHLMSGQTFTMDMPGVKDLYAIWSEAGALFGYTMTINTGNFSGGVPAGFVSNGQTSISKSLKYVDERREYNYDYAAPNSAGMTIVVTENRPADANTQADEHYTFITWYNKNYDKPNPVEGDDVMEGANPNNAGRPFISPGGTVYFGETNTVFSLDAVWARVPGGSQRKYFSESEQAPGGVKLHVVGGEDITPAAFNTLDPTYSVTVTKDGTQVQSVGPTAFAAEEGHHTGKGTADIGCLDIPLAMPAVLDVGVYTYEITVNLGGVEVTGEVTFIIDPLVQFSVTKELKNREWKSGDSFDFELSEPSNPGTAELTVSYGMEGHKVLSDTFRLLVGKYDFNVAEVIPAVREPGMTYAADQTIHVEYEDTKPYTVVVAGEPKSGNVIEVPFTLTNTYETGTLAITKKITHDPKHDTGNTFKDESSYEFTITTEPKLNGKYGELTFTNGTADYTMNMTNLPAIAQDMEQTKKFSGLPVGVAYTVAETENDAYATTIEQPTVILQAKNTEDAPAEVVVTNAHNPGTLTISKRVSDPYLNGRGGAEEKQFKFEVSLFSDTNSPATIDKATLQIGSESKELTFTDGKATLTLENGQTAVIKSLDLNTVKGYKVEEIAYAAPGVSAEVTEGWTEIEESYTTTANGQPTTIAAGEIGENISASAAFVNTFKTGALSVTKEVYGVGNTAIRFPMVLTLSGDVYEEHQEQFTPERLEAACRSSGVSATAAVGADQAEISFSLRGGQTLTLSDLPMGIAFSVRETTANTDGFHTVYKLNGKETDFTDTVIKNGAPQAVTVENRYASADLTIAKRVDGGGSAARAFDIRIELPGTEFTSVTKDRSYQVDYEAKSSFREGAAPDSIRFNGGIGVLTLYSGESATIKDLPQGVYFNITEPDAGEHGYAVTYEKDGESAATCGYTLSSNMSVTVVNTYSAGALTVTKLVNGAAGEKDRAFNFTVTLNDSSVQGPRGDGVTFENGVASFTLKHGESKLIRGLSTGVGYTVTETEADQDGYTTTYTNQNGTIGATTVAAVTVTNHRDAAAEPPGGGGGGVLPPWIWATPEANPTPTPGASPSPSPSAGPSPTPGSTPGPGQTSQPFGTPQPTHKPGTTSQPFTPGTGSGTGGTGSGGATAPATGDETAIAPWAALLALSAAGLAAVLTIGRKRRGRG